MFVRWERDKGDGKQREIGDEGECRYRHVHEIAKQQTEQARLAKE